MRPFGPAAVIILLAATAPVLGETGEPMVIVLDWVDGNATGAAGVGPGALQAWPVWIDACHRRIWVDLLYEPAAASVTVNDNGVAVPYQFSVELAVGNVTLSRTLTDPGFSQPMGETSSWGAGILTLRLERGSFVDWSLRLRAWEIPEEPACVPTILINEVEANPDGTDAGNEWVELHNPGSFDVDLGGWFLESTHGVTNQLELLANFTVPRTSFRTVTFDAQFLDNENESVRLLLPSLDLHDETPVQSDEADDGRTWQRTPDGGHDWTFRPSTQGASNVG